MAVSTQKAPPIVAELGRPETPAETAQRKAEASRRHRTNQTLFNLVVAIVACLVVVVFLVAVVVRPNPQAADPVDYRSLASDAQGATDVQLIAPVMPPGWSSNQANYGTKNEVLDWYIGFLTPSTQFIALDQGIDANPTWQSGILTNVKPTSTATVDGIEWTIYDHRTAESPGNFAYSMSSTIGRSTVILHGTGSTDEFMLLADAIAADQSGQ